MYDKSLVLGLIDQIEEALRRIERRFSAIGDPKEFVVSDEGLDRLDAIAMMLIAIGENIKKIDKISQGELLAVHPEIEWPGVAVAAVRRVRSDGGKAPKVTMADFEAVLAPASAGRSLFSALDALLVESATQLAEPVGKVHARLDLGPEGLLEGDILWADAGYIKVREAETDRALILPKEKVIRIESLAGAASLRREEVTPDPWTRTPGMA